MTQLALITGAAGGLGRAVAARLHERGWRLALVSRDAQRLDGAQPGAAVLVSSVVARIGVLNHEAVAAGAMAWLLSDDARWVTGQVLPVDGGFTAVRPMVKG